MNEIYRQDFCVRRQTSQSMLRNEQDSEKKKAQEKRDKESSSRDSETTRAQEK
jgi:hypothetical protein